MNFSVQRSVQDHFKSLNHMKASYLYRTPLIGSKDYTILVNASEDRSGGVLLQGHNVVAYVFL